MSVPRREKCPHYIQASAASECPATPSPGAPPPVSPGRVRRSRMIPTRKSRSILLRVPSCRGTRRSAGPPSQGRILLNAGTVTAHHAQRRSAALSLQVLPATRRCNKEGGADACRCKCEIHSVRRRETTAHRRTPYQRNNVSNAKLLRR